MESTNGVMNQGGHALDTSIDPLTSCSVTVWRTANCLEDSDRTSPQGEYSGEGTMARYSHTPLHFPLGMMKDKGTLSRPWQTFIQQYEVILLLLLMLLQLLLLLLLLLVLLLLLLKKL